MSSLSLVFNLFCLLEDRARVTKINKKKSKENSLVFWPYSSLWTPSGANLCCSWPCSRPNNKCRWHNFKWFIFNLQRQKINTVLYKVAHMYTIFKCGFPWMQKSLSWCGGHRCMVRTSLHSGPMLKIDCPISYKPLAPTPSPKPSSFSDPHAYACNAILLWKTTLARRKLSPSGNKIKMKSVSVFSQSNSAALSELNFLSLDKLSQRGKFNLRYNF